MDIKVIDAVKSVLLALIQPALKAINVRQKLPTRLEVKGIDGTKVVLELLIPLDQLEPKVQQQIRRLKL
ncbi:MAG TPA: hypothetical protein VM888_03610 [Chitinophagaceae bacterium]|jgi:hypothetical protein|nr:hypothetical protein [Chitinophagaceae bacterium]